MQRKCLVSNNSLITRYHYIAYGSYLPDELFDNVYPTFLECFISEGSIKFSTDFDNVLAHHFTSRDLILLRITYIWPNESSSLAKLPQLLIDLMTHRDN